jgi:hypothetical protein
MPDEKAKKMADEALTRLMAELESGRSEALKNYLATMGRFHRYSWNNALLIHAQRPTATRVAGFRTWHEMGRAVKRGEKGIAIMAPILVKNKGAERIVEKLAKPEDAYRLTGFRTAYVFDVGQTDGKPLPNFSQTTGDPKEYGDKLKALVAGRGIALEYDPTIAPALGVSSGGRIRLVPGLSPAEEFSVLTHELAHEMLHHDKKAAALPIVVRETQAEAVAFVVSNGVGLETNRAQSDYIALYNGDPKTLADSLAVIQETSAKILNDLLVERERAEMPKTFSAKAEGLPAPLPPQSPEHSDSVSLDR